MFFLHSTPCSLPLHVEPEFVCGVVQFPSARFRVLPWDSTSQMAILHFGSRLGGCVIKTPQMCLNKKRQYSCLFFNSRLSHVLWWSRTNAEEIKENMTMETARGRQSLPFEEKFHMLGDFLNQTTTSHESLGELRQKKKGMVERCPSLQKQTRSLESKMQTTGGTSLQHTHCRVIKLVMVSSGCGPTRRGSCIVREQHVWQRSHGRSKNCRCCPKTLRKACEGLWGWVCEERSNAVLESMQHELAWKSTYCWRHMQALNMPVVPNDHTRWGGHNRGCVGRNLRLSARAVWP